MNFDTKSNIVVLSDVHIGTNQPTCWYQASVHEPYLIAILQWVKDNAASIDQLVLLGDLVDFWTYPCENALPGFTDIIEANPNIFGRIGALGAAIDALGGEVYYLTGNHDMNVTAADIGEIVSPQGHSPKFLDVGNGLDELGFYQPMLPSGAPSGIALGHGHYYTLFNAPDENTSWEPMPVGHFVTRMIASHWARTLQPGQTVADLPGQGAPMGITMLPFLLATLSEPWKSGGNNANIPALLLNWVAGQMGWNDTHPIVMLDGGTTTLDEVKTVYQNLWSNWAARQAALMNSPEAGQIAAYKAALADALAWYLGWFAQQASIQNGYDLVVMGHTHVPIAGMTGGVINYVNSGFECPSVPDMGTQQISFAVIDRDTKQTTLLQARKSSSGPIEIVPCPAASVSPVPPPAMDFSCYITIENNQGFPLTLTGSTIGHGYLTGPLPQQIAPNSVARIWLTDYPGGHGSDGSVTYQYPGGASYTFAFDCPTGVLPNTCSGGSWFKTKAGDPNGPWGPIGSIARYGHPFSVTFGVES
ncbi:MAG: metallophosphoesterase [Rhodobacteraceae bacterium]|nr:metallophosphoesterase [Paracoccaceae bacterium]